MDMSQTELGNQLGVSFQQIQKYEKGSNRIRFWPTLGDFPSIAGSD
ncbi:UNVERIFIED_CONTAM: hypothetical protein GTU68_048984 [Idotea baltica]|nr:hypothetical protein [Idotea baltica]